MQQSNCRSRTSLSQWGSLNHKHFCVSLKQGGSKKKKKTPNPNKKKTHKWVLRKLLRKNASIPGDSASCVLAPARISCLEQEKYVVFYHTPQHRGGPFEGTGAGACSPGQGKVMVLDTAAPSRVDLRGPLLCRHFNQNFRPLSWCFTACWVLPLQRVIKASAGFGQRMVASSCLWIRVSPGTKGSRVSCGPWDGSKTVIATAGDEDAC